MLNKKSSLLGTKFGNKLRALRKQTGMSQEELGFRTGLDRTYISGIERGERNPTLKNVNKIAKALKVSLSDLVTF